LFVKIEHGNKQRITECIWLWGYVPSPKSYFVQDFRYAWNVIWKRLWCV